MQRDRIAYLDGLRAVAIALVLLHHYLSRWTYPIEPINLYPYGDAFASFALAKYGYFGVQLFFVISGFVITLTLTHCSTALEFTIRRFARLWPTMALCSVLTWLVVPLIPGAPFTISARNFLPSMTFIEPSVFSYLSRSGGFDWMDGAYWSLWVEVRFYFWMAVLYFVSPRRFASTVAAFSIVVLGAYTVALCFQMTKVLLLLKGIFIAQHLPWFLLGIAFCLRHQRKPGKAPGVVKRALSVKPLTYVGASSYSLYLLHQKIGVSILHALPGHGAVTILYAFGVTALMILVASTIYRLWETPLSRAIVKRATHVAA